MEVSTAAKPKEQYKNYFILFLKTVNSTRFLLLLGGIGHQFRECANYKGQQKEDLAFGPWLKAVSLVDRTKLNRHRQKWSKEPEKSKGEVSESESTENPNPDSPTMNPGHEFGSLLNQEKIEASRSVMGVGHVERVTVPLTKPKGANRGFYRWMTKSCTVPA